MAARYLWPTRGGMVDRLVELLMEQGDVFEPATYQGADISGGTTSQVATFTPAAGRGPFVAHGITSNYVAAFGNGYFYDALSQLTIDAKNVFYAPVSYESIVNKAQMVENATDWLTRLGAPGDVANWPAPLPMNAGSKLLFQKNAVSITTADVLLLTGFHVSDAAYAMLKALPVLGGFGFALNSPAPTAGVGQASFTLPKDLFARFWGVQNRAAATIGDDLVDVQVWYDDKQIVRAGQIGAVTVLGGPGLYHQPYARIDMPMRAGGTFAVTAKLETGATGRYDYYSVIGQQAPENI